jgi:ArsR family transcriptional regulator
MINAPDTGARPEALLGWMDGLADPTRLRLLRVLEHQELGVVELCEILQLPQSTVSRHLKVLADQDWLENRRQGTANLYRMAPGLQIAARKLWRLVREQTEGWATVLQDDLRLEVRLRARRDETERFFSGAAGDWNQLRAELYGATFGRRALFALLPPEWTVADLGCGTGELTFELAHHVRRVIGIDQSAAMLRAARRRTEGLANVALHRSELEAIAIEDGACDAAILVLVLAYVADVPPILSEVGRILRPGGALVLIDLMRHDDEDFCRRMGQARLGFDPTELRGLLATAGFDASRVAPLPPEPGARAPALLLARAEKRSPQPQPLAPRAGAEAP